MSVILLGQTGPKIPAKSPGIRIRHRTKSHGIALIPINQRPIMGLKRNCPTCQIFHPVKTIHLYLDSDGGCLVSEGVLQDLKLAGMPDIDIVANVANPPPITIGRNRLEVDQENSKIRYWKEPVIV